MSSLKYDKNEIIYKTETQMKTKLLLPKTKGREG